MCLYVYVVKRCANHNVLSILYTFFCVKIRKKMYMTCSTYANKIGGYVDVDWFRVSK